MGGERKMKGYEWMDWAQLGGILAVISAIVTTWLLMARDNKSLERDHGDLSKDHTELKSGQKNLSNKLSVHEKNRVSDVHKLDKVVTEIMKETNRVSTFLSSEKEKEQQKLSLLSYKQQDIQESLDHLSGLFAEIEEVNLLNAKLVSEREELLKINKELRISNQQLRNKNQELLNKLAHKHNKNRSNGLER